MCVGPHDTYTWYKEALAWPDVERNSVNDGHS